MKAITIFILITLALALSGCQHLSDVPVLSDVADAVAEAQLYKGRNVGEARGDNKMGNVTVTISIHQAPENPQAAKALGEGFRGLIQQNVGAKTATQQHEGGGGVDASGGGAKGILGGLFTKKEGAETPE